MIPDEELTARLTEALFAHRHSYVHFRSSTGDGQRFTGCTCGWKLTWPKPSQWQPAPPPAETFEHHRAAALLPVVRNLQAEALDQAAPAMDDWQDRAELHVRAAVLRGEAQP